MSSLPRFLALSLVLLVTLLIAALAAQSWLRRQEQRLRLSAQQRLETQLEAAVALTASSTPEWTDERLAAIGRVLGAEVRRSDLAPTNEVSPLLGVQVEPGVWLAVEPPLPLASRWLFLYQRVLLALGILALLLTIALLVALAARRAAEPEPSADPHPAHPRDALSLAQLAKTNVSNEAALVTERDERLRAEEEALVRLQLLNRALEEKIRIGRDLHDGVIQSLYAAGLTLQSAQSAAARDPAEADRRIESTLEAINRTITEIRGYINGLSPLAVRGNSIGRAIEETVEELSANRPIERHVSIDEQIAARLSDDQMTNTLQIAREAVSNAVRHAQPTRLDVSLLDEAGQVVLTIVDDGKGFAEESLLARGHGLANMRGRAERLGGTLEVSSQPGRGTRIRLVWPSPSFE